MDLKSQVGDRAFKLGSSGQVVEAIQLGLRSVGYALKGTGYFGPATDVAVSSFQKRVGLAPDGVFGFRSATALDNEMGRLTAAATPGPETVLEVGRPLWVEAGLKLIGTKEGPGSSDNKVIIDWAKEEGGDVAKAYTHDEIPWCALFANHILTHVGLKGTETLWALDFAGKWPSIRLDGPAVGAFAPMLRNGGGHIICVVGKDQNGNIMGLSGNQANQVSIVPFPPSRLNKGFWWPDSVPAPKLVGIGHLPVVRSDGRVSVKES